MAALSFAIHAMISSVDSELLPSPPRDHSISVHATGNKAKLKEFKKI
jgi:hypothetical protein